MSERHRREALSSTIRKNSRHGLLQPGRGLGKAPGQGQIRWIDAVAAFEQFEGLVGPFPNAAWQCDRRHAANTEATQRALPRRLMVRRPPRVVHTVLVVLIGTRVIPRS